MTTKVEGLVLIIVILFQFRFYFVSAKSIRKLTLFFPNHSLGEHSIESTNISGNNVLLLKLYEDDNENFASIIESINRYLIKNKGITDFSIIKSIIERKLDGLEEEGTANISLPLYVGLMGTFIGITLGLANIAYNFDLTKSNTIIPINDLLCGVVLAMVGSFIGLLLTVVNTSFNFKRAKAESEFQKNLFYDFLQVELLPHLQNGLFDALDRLALNINDFNGKFQNNIQLFDTKFAVNISSLNESVSALSGNMSAIIENTKSQQEFLKELKAIGYNKMAEANVRVFSLLNEALPTLMVFIEKQKELNESVNSASLVVNAIQSIMNRLKTFEESVNNLGSSISTNEFLGNETLRRIDINLKYLDTQYELLKQHGIDSSSKIEDFFTEETRRISNLTDTIKREVQEALSINIAENPFQKLLLLESVDSQLKIMHLQFGIRDENNRENNLNLKTSINDISLKLEAITSNTSPRYEKSNKNKVRMNIIQSKKTNRGWKRFIGFFRK